MNPYAAVSVSYTDPFPRWDYTNSVAVDIEFEDRLAIEDSRNWYAWIEALDDESYVDLREMR